MSSWFGFWGDRQARGTRSCPCAGCVCHGLPGKPLLLPGVPWRSSRLALKAAELGVEVAGWSPGGSGPGSPCQLPACCGGGSELLLPSTPHQPAQEGAETEAGTSKSFPQADCCSVCCLLLSSCGFIPLEFLGTELGANCPRAQARVFWDVHISRSLSSPSAGAEPAAGAPASPFLVTSVRLLGKEQRSNV